MKVVLAGAGGYGTNYLNWLLSHPEHGAEICGIVEKYMEFCPNRALIEQAKIPVYDTLEDYYARETADLAVISTPSFCHCSQTVCALEHDSYVLCEKPAAPTVEEVETMIHTARRHRRWAAIGYHWSFSAAIRGLKADILEGRLGRKNFLWGKACAGLCCLQCLRSLSA